LHQITRKISSLIFQISHTKITSVIFHPNKPLLYLAFRNEILTYDLANKGIISELSSNCTNITSLAIHPLGDHLIIGSEDKKVCWYDLGACSQPYRVMKYHMTPVQAVAFHKSEPLFASVADDGSCQVFHGMVFKDSMTSPLLVPINILQGHELVDYRGLTDCAFHPMQPWIFTSGVDGKCILFCN
jgi:ribosome biogenesis protein ERB1